MLPLDDEQPFRVAAPAPDQLEQALADLLLDALAKSRASIVIIKGARDESEDHI
jgi:hypothetical protein